MPVDFSKYGGSSSSKKKSGNSTSVDFSVYSPVHAEPTADRTRIEAAKETQRLKDYKKASDHKQYADAMKSSRLMEIENRKQEQYKEQMANARLMEQPVKEKLYKNQMEKARMMEIQNNTPTYRERINKELSGIPAILRPIASPIVALNQAPFMIAARQMTGAAPAEEENYAPVTGGGKLAGQALTTLGNITFSGAPMGGIYQRAGGAIEKYAPQLLTSVGGRAGAKAIQGVAEGVPTSIGQQLIMNPESSAKELGEAALYGGGISAVLPGGGQLVKEGVQGLLGMGKNAASDVVEANIRSAMDELGVIPRGQKEPLKATIGGKKAPVVPNVIPEEPVQPVEAPKQAQAAPVVSPKIAQLDAEHAKYKENLRAQQQSGAISREQAEKQIKGHAMQTAAKKREIIQGDSLVPVDGGLTTKELEAKLKYLRSDYKGKEVIAGGREGKVKNVSFGKVVVEYPDGTTKSFNPEYVKPKVDIDDAIRKQSQPVEPKPVEPVKEVPLPTPAHEAALAYIRENPNAGVNEVQSKFKLGYVEIKKLQDIARAEGGVPVVPPVAREIPKAPKEPKTENTRGFMETMDESERIIPEVKEQLKDSAERTYKIKSDAEALAEGKRRINEGGLEKTAADLARKEKNYTKEDLVTGLLVIDEYQKAGNIEGAVRFAEQVSKELTNAGQVSQAASILDRLSPEGALVYMSRQVEKMGKELKTQDAGEIINLARAAQKAGQSQERSANVQEIAQKIRNKEDVSPEELAELTNFLDDAKDLLGKPKPVKEKPPKLTSDKKVREQMLNVLNEKEAALKEFIRKNTNRLSSTPLDLWGAYAALGAVKLAKGAISFSKWSEEMIKDVGEGIRPHLSRIFDRSQREVDQLGHLIPPKSTVEKVAQKYIDADRLTPKDAQLIHDLASRIGKMSTNDRAEAARQMQGILNKYEKSSVWDKINALRFVAMLGNTGTQLVNAVSSPIMMLERHLLDMAVTPLDIARSKITGGPRKVTFKQGPGVWDDFFTPAADYVRGVKVGGKSGWEGIDPKGITSAHDIRGLAHRSKWNPFRYAEGGLGAVMKGADYGAYNAAYQKKLRQMAYLDALNKGVKGDQEIKNYMGRYINNLDANIEAMADKYGKEMTFQSVNKITQGAQSLQRGLNKLTLGDKHGLGSAILPFVKTPTNLVIAGLERSPVGMFKGFYQLATMAKNPDIAPGEIANTFAKAIFGTAGLTGAGYVLGKLGILTGDSASSNKDMQSLEADVGKGKFLFNTTAFSRMMESLVSGNIDDVQKVSKFQPGDKQLSYNKLQPFAFPVSMGATFAEQRRQAEAAKSRGGNIPLSDQLGGAGVAGLKSIYDMSLLKGLQDMFDVQPGQTPVDTIKEFGQNYLKSFSPSLGAQEARREDPYQRQTPYKGLTAPVTDYFKSRTPGESQELPPRITNLGEPKKNPRGIAGTYLNPLMQKEGQYNEAAQVIYDIIKQTGDESLAPSPVDKKLSGRKDGQKIEITLDTRQLAELQQIAGKEIAKRVLALGENLTPEEKARALKSIYEKSKAYARNEYKRKLGWSLLNM